MAQKSTTVAPTVNEAQKYGGKWMTVPFNEITEPGAYYFHTTGALYRIPPECLAPGHSPMLNIYCDDQCLVTKISNDPWIPVSKAREICSNWDFFVNF